MTVKSPLNHRYVTVTPPLQIRGSAHTAHAGLLSWLRETIQNAEEADEMQGASTLSESGYINNREILVQSP